MIWFWQRWLGIGASGEAGGSANETAPHAPRAGGGKGLATVISATALVFSGFSLWETALKQAELTVYVTGDVTYERDVAADEFREYVRPAGGFEVFAVPVTIANSGARDAAVLAMLLEAKNPKTGLTARFKASYTADDAYFANGGAKPKKPFSALIIAGRSAWTGTVLFYPVSYSNGKALTPARTVARFYQDVQMKYRFNYADSKFSSFSELLEKLPDFPERAELSAYEQSKVLGRNDKVEVTLRFRRPAPSGWLDRVLGTQSQPISMTWEMPDIPGERVARGELVRLRSANDDLEP